MNAEEIARDLFDLEKLSAEIHKCYCRAYEKRFGKPYWTNGDYSKLEEVTKDYDREMARFMMRTLISYADEKVEEAARVAEEFGLKVDDETGLDNYSGADIATEIRKLKSGE